MSKPIRFRDENGCVVAYYDLKGNCSSLTSHVGTFRDALRVACEHGLSLIGKDELSRFGPRLTVESPDRARIDMEDKEAGYAVIATFAIITPEPA